jgi:hypothetical protein
VADESTEDEWVIPVHFARHVEGLMAKGFTFEEAWTRTQFTPSMYFELKDEE